MCYFKQSELTCKFGVHILKDRGPSKIALIDYLLEYMAKWASDFVNNCTATTCFPRAITMGICSRVHKDPICTETFQVSTVNW